MNIYRLRGLDKGLHILIWVVLLTIPAVLIDNGRYGGLTKTFYFISSIYHIGVFYFVAYYLQPKLLNKNWWWLFILSLPVITYFSYHLKLFTLRLDPDFVRTRQSSRTLFFGIVPFFIAAVIFRIVLDRLRFERLEKEAKAEKLASELKFLRSQISPHFLFNMMTNMVSLARQGSSLLEPSLIKLSELLRYMLYDSQEQKIAISAEISLLKNYVELQKLRFDENVNVSLIIECSDENNWIEPMLLIPFIENAFKHGIGLQENPYISIHVAVDKATLSFSTRNSYKKDHSSKDRASGIGLLNVKNRLELLYPGKYAVQIKDENSEFSVHLNLNLS